MDRENGEKARYYYSEEEADDVRILPDRGHTAPKPRDAYAAYAPSRDDLESPRRTTAPRGRKEVAPTPPPYNDSALTTTPTAGYSAAPVVAAAQPQVTVRRAPSTCAIVALTLGLLSLACMLLGYATVRDGLGGFGKLGGFMPNISFGLVTTPTVTIDTSRPSVIDRVQALSKLETVHYQVEKVISGSSTGPLPAPLTGDKILLVAHGEVVAGIDLSKLRSQDVVVAGDAVTMTLPAPEILYSKLDNSKTYVYDRETGIFSKPDATLESQLRAAAEQQIVQAANEDNIMDQARQNAEQTLRTLIEGLGYKDVYFEEGR